MKNSYSHIYLYAKGHYVKTDSVEDMKVILGHRSGLGADVIRLIDIVRVLTEVAWKHMTGHKFGEFVERLNPELDFPFRKDDSPAVRTIQACLNSIMMVQVKDIDGNTIFELDEPDSNILPLSNPKEVA